MKSGAGLCMILRQKTVLTWDGGEWGHHAVFSWCFFSYGYFSCSLYALVHMPLSLLGAFMPALAPILRSCEMLSLWYGCMRLFFWCYFFFLPLNSSSSPSAAQDNSWVRQPTTFSQQFLSVKTGLNFMATECCQGSLFLFSLFPAWLSWNAPRHMAVVPSHFMVCIIGIHDCLKNHRIQKARSIVFWECARYLKYLRFLFDNVKIWPTHLLLSFCLAHFLHSIR